MLLLDDDPVILKLLSLRLRKRFPSVAVDCQPQPDSLVLALSGTLDADALKRLINCGCAGAFHKSSTSEIDAVLATIWGHLAGANASALVSSRPPAPSPGMSNRRPGSIQPEQTSPGH